MFKTRLIALLAGCFAAFSTFATVDYLRVNHITKELYWGDEDHSTGWLGWEGVPDGIYEETTNKYEDLGYSYTQFPFKIELALIGLVLGFLVFIRRKRRKIINTT
ncbi:MAG: hypothetical protein COA58_15215 [Bacteroidetes bacterium]|nr:MAG: hypothetical protein COA58_15215 [Bacteroidota bacterium]